MRRMIAGGGLVFLAGAASGPAQVWETDPAGGRLPPAQDVLARVRAAFPAQPWRVVGQLLGRDRGGEIIRTLNAALLLDYAADPPRAEIEIRDAFGGLIGRLDVVRPGNGPAKLALTAGEPPLPVDPFDPNAAVGDSDFTWADLALDFLWWPGGRVTATEMKKSRECYVVDLPAPAAGPVARVRLWIDTREFAMLQADAFDGGNRLIRRLAVKSLKKMDDRWMVEDIDIESYPSRTRTVLRVMESYLLPVGGDTAQPGRSGTQHGSATGTQPATVGDTAPVVPSAGTQSVVEEVGGGTAP